MHVDTGHNFPEVDRVPRPPRRRTAIVASVQESIDQGRVVEETGPRASRNRLQTTTLLDAIARARLRRRVRRRAPRRGARPREGARVLLPRRLRPVGPAQSQRPELWNLYNGRVRRGEHIRVFPLSNWTELDVWEYILAEELEIPSLYVAHEREVFERDGMLYAVSDFIERMDGEEPFTRVGALPHRRRHELHRRRRVARHLARRRRGRDRRDARHRARRDARRRPRVRGRHGGPQEVGYF